jgi:putative tricarboxylic transport membrane protein
VFGPLLGSLGDILQPQYLTPLAIGTLAGLVGGVLPGVTITMTTR